MDSTSVEPLRLHLAASFLQRAAGLFLLGRLAPNEGLWIRPCHSIHTFGLGYPIDVVFLDVHGRVLKTVHALHPNRVAWCRRAWSVVELPAHYCRRHRNYQTVLRQAMACQHVGNTLNPTRC